MTLPASAQHGFDCPQAPGILQIGKELNAFRDEMRQRDNKFIEALERIADQGARISGVEEHLQEAKKDMESRALELKKDIENIFERQRKMEAVIGPEGSTIDLKVGTAVDDKLEKLVELFTLLTSWPAITIATVLAVLTVVGALFDLWYHFEGVQRLFQAYKMIK